MSFRLSQRSKDRLKGVHPDLIRVVELAISLTSVDFAITEGLRTRERQAHLLKEGKSKTMNSRHITGHAVDLAAWVGNTVSWDFSHYIKIAEAMKKASQQLSVPIVWGGDWKTFKDGPHFELDRRFYP